MVLFSLWMSEPSALSRSTGLCATNNLLFNLNDYLQQMNLPEEVIVDSMARLERGPELMKDALLAIERDSAHRLADLEMRQAYSEELRSKLDTVLADSACAAEVVKRWGGGNGETIKVWTGFFESYSLC